MAVCKRCGCAIPIGRKTCDMCAVTGAIAPAQPWVPPVNAAGPAELASSAASWAGGHQNRPGLSADLEKARKEVRRATRYFAVLGLIMVSLGVLAEALDWTAIQGFFNWFAAAEGAVFLTIAFFSHGGSVVAIGIGAGLYLLDTVALAFTGHFSFVRLIILAVMIRAVMAANMLRQQRKLQQPPQDQARAA